MRRLSLLSTLTLALLALGGITSASASAEVINFDDIDAPGPGGSGAFVTQTHGVTFTNTYAFDYGKGSFAIPDFPHSKPVAVEACVAVEFCSSPLTASFTTAQRSVAAWVGYDGPITSPLHVRLTGLNAAGASVGKADVNLPAKSPVTNIATRLAIDLTSPQIRKVEVSVIKADGTNGFNAGLAIDDLEYSTASPPPPCEATKVPTVTLDQPTDGTVVQNDAFLLEGNVDNGNSSITSASVVAGSATPHTGSAFPIPIDSDGGHFGPISYGGILSPGENDVHVTATNCLGTADSPHRKVTWAALPSGAYFRQVGQIEVTQAVQTPDNQVPLIAASAAGIKPTIARAYLSVEGTSANVRDVTGRLTATLPDGSPAPGPRSVRSRNFVIVTPSETLELARRHLASSLYFDLPPEWQQAGALHLQLQQIEIDGRPTLACVDCDNGGPGRTVRFHSVPPLRISLVSVPYGGGQAVYPRDYDVGMLASWLRRAYPTSDLRITRTSIPPLSARPTNCKVLNATLINTFATEAAQDPTSRFYGMVSDDDGFMRGCSQIDGQFGSGPVGPPSRRGYGWDHDGTYADWYGGHELGHMYGRHHPGFCGNPRQPPDDASFPYANGLLSDAAEDGQGFDDGVYGYGLPRQVYDWRDGWTDVMTYCDNEWVSPYTYRGIVDKICAETGTCSTLAPSAPRNDASRAAHRKAGGRRLAVNGSLDRRSAKVRLTSLAAMGGLELTKRPRHSAYAIVLRGSGGRVVGRFPFKPNPLSDQRAGRLAAIGEVIPFSPRTRRVEVRKGKRRLATATVSRHAPSVHVLTPRKGENGRVTLRWRSGDRDGDHRTYTVLYSADGHDYTPIAGNLRKRRLSVDLGLQPGGPAARFRVIANDGVRTSSDTSAPIPVPVKPPRVTISSPQANEEFPAGDPVTFTASVEDLQDVPFDAERVVWRSSIQGDLGRGTAISATLEPGTHEITATATNSGGQSDVARVTVKAVAQPPFFDGGP